MAFAHSIGQDFFKDLLHYTDDKFKGNDNKSIKTNYELQKRLSNFWKNNDKPVLLKSEKYSGEVSLFNNKPEPLGGPINWNNNCTDEFPFWSFSKKESLEEEKDIKNPVNKNLNIEKKNNITEHFTPTIVPIKENFNGNTTFVIIAVVAILLLTLIFFLRRI